MNRQIASMISAAALSVILGATSAQAASGVAEIPFSFQVKSTTLPAGQYHVSTFKDGTNNWIFKVADIKGHVTFVSAPYKREVSEEESQLTFDCRNACALTSITLPGTGARHTTTPVKSLAQAGFAAMVSVKVAH